MTAPSITLTRLDVQRLERLIDSLDDTLPGIEALCRQVVKFAEPLHRQTALLPLGDHASPE